MNEVVEITMSRKGHECQNKCMESRNVFSNLVWRFLERAGAQSVTFIVSIVLARILEPETYGMIAIVTVFTSILQVFVDAGLGRALIQKKNADNLDFSSVFWFNLAFSSALYIILFLIAPFIALFYEIPLLKDVVRVQSLILVISSLKNVQQSYVAVKMIFKKFFFATLGGTLGAAVVGISMAYMGYGVWALVGQYIFNTTVDTIILWTIVKWRPEFKFSFSRLKKLFLFGWKLLISGLLDVGYRNLNSLIIGKVYSTTDLAFYNRGNQFPNVIVTNINASIDSVLLPVMSKEQDNKDAVKRILRRSIKTSVYLMAPMLIGIGACGESLVKVLLTDKWLSCVPYLRIFCLTYIFLPISSSNLNALNAIGRSDLFLRLEIIKKVIGITSIFFAVKFGVMALAISNLILEIPYIIINAWPNKKLLSYSVVEQILDIMPEILVSLFMGIVVYLIHYVHLHVLLLLIIQMTVGILIYVGGSILFKVEEFYYVKKLILGYLKNNR